MKTFLLSFEHDLDVNNQICVVLNLNTIPPWFITFKNYCLDIMTDKDNHGYSKKEKDLYDVALYCKNKLHIASINLHIEKPEIIKIM